jgi:hypothetical protein
MTPTALKAAVVQEAGRMPGLFGFTDIADRLGADYGVGGDHERRLRRALYALRRSGALITAGRGQMQAGTGGGGAGVEMIQAVDVFMVENGGVARAEEICTALGLDGAGRRTLHRVLEAGRYEPLPPMHDGRRWWALRDDERDALALPGWRIEIDHAVENLRAGRSWRLGVTAITARRSRIGLGVQDARDAADLDLGSLLEAVGDLFVFDLERGRAPVLTVTATGGEIERTTVRLGDFWRGEIKREGREAVRRAWLELEEGGSLGSPWPGSALSAATWAALAAVVGVDPAALSRGSHGIPLNP